MLQEERENHTDSIHSIVTKHLLIAVLLIINALVLMSFVTGFHRLLAESESDIGEYLSILATLISSFPLIHVSYILIYGKKSANLASVKVLKRLILAGLISLWCLSLVLWLLIIPWRGQLDFDSAIEAKDAKNYSTAIDLLQRSLYKLGENPSAHYSLAEIHEELADYEKAKRHYRLGIYADPVYPKEAFNNLALLLLQDNDMIGALDLLDLAEARIQEEQDQNIQWAQTGVINKNRAWAYWKLDFNEEAIKEVNKAIKNLSASSTLADYPEATCLTVLISKMPDNSMRDSIFLSEPQAREACQKAWQNTRTKSIYGAPRDLYIQALK